MKNLDSILVIIPAKKNSTRLSNKNLKLFNGHPLIYYSIKFALKSGLKNIVVSSDCEKILTYSKKFNVITFKRPKNLSLDSTPTISVIEHATKLFIKKHDYIKTIVTLQPTSPLRTINLFNHGYEKFINGNFDSLISVGLNKRKIGVIDSKGCYKTLNYELGSRSQDLNKQFFENGLIYFSKLDNILKGNLLGIRIGTILVDDITSLVDIDYQEEFELAEFLIKKYNYLFSYLEN